VDLETRKKRRQISKGASGVRRVRHWNKRGGQSKSMAQLCFAEEGIVLLLMVIKKIGGMHQGPKNCPGDKS